MLPKQFYIKNDSTNPVFSKFIKDSRTRFNHGLSGDASDTAYYGINRNGVFDFYFGKTCFGADAVEITPEQYFEMIKTKFKVGDVVQVKGTDIVGVLFVELTPTSDYQRRWNVKCGGNNLYHYKESELEFLSPSTLAMDKIDAVNQALFSSIPNTLYPNYPAGCVPFYSTETTENINISKWTNPNGFGYRHPDKIFVSDPEYKSINNNQTKQYNGQIANLPRKTPEITRGAAIRGNSISGSKFKANITVGYFSNKERHK